MIPIFLVTGFLGSGKTTLIRNRLGRDTAIIVNEIGDIPIDHHLLSVVSEKIVVLPGGCLCCAVREDLEVTLGMLQGHGRELARVVIETSGLADPAPILATLKTNPWIRTRFFLDRVVTVVDAVRGAGTITTFPEAAKQVALADRLVVSKGDLVADTGALKMALRAVNAAAAIVDGTADDLFSGPPLHDPAASVAAAERWLGQAADHGGGAFRTVNWTWDRPIDWTLLSVWLTLLLSVHGDRIVRVKGLLDVANARGPIALHGVQHAVDPPLHLEDWGGFPRRSHLVFVLRGLEPQALLRSFRAFMGLEVSPARLEDYLVPVGAGGTIAGRPVRRPSAPAWVKG